VEFKKEKHKPYQSEYHSLHCLDTQVIESAKAHFLQNYIEGNGKIFYIKEEIYYAFQTSNFDG